MARASRYTARMSAVGPTAPQAPVRLIAAALAVFLLGAYLQQATCAAGMLVLWLSRVDYGPASLKPVNGVLDAARASIIHQTDWLVIAHEVIWRGFPVAIVVFSVLLIGGRGPLAWLVRRVA